MAPPTLPLRLLTNPGGAPPMAAMRRYGATLLPQRILVDGKDHDTRTNPSLAEIDRWVKEAREHPHLLGTSAAEMVEAMRKLAETDQELLVMTASQKLVGTYRAALSAEKTLRSLPIGRNVRTSVIDTNTVDIGTGLLLIYAAEARLAGHDFDMVLKLTREATPRGFGALVPRTLDYLRKGGRATFLRTMTANLLDVSPIIGVVDGELTPIGRAKRSDLITPLIETIATRVKPGQRVWAGVGSAGSRADNETLAAKIRATWKVELYIEQLPAATTYLQTGPGSMTAFILPIESPTWTPGPVQPFL